MAPQATVSNKKELKPLSSRPNFNVALQGARATPAQSKTASPSSKDKGKAKAVSSRPVEVVDLTSDDEVQGDEVGLWIDQFQPRNRDELGVHPRKVTDVAGWIEEAYNPRLSKYRRLLVMSGPSGAAKTACLRILAHENDIDLVEFRNPSNATVANEQGGRETLVDHFTSFLTRAGMAPALDLGPDPEYESVAKASTSTRKDSFADGRNKKRLILLEDLPNTSHYPTKLALRSALLQYLKSPRVTCPLVLIISEALARPGIGPDADSATSSIRRDESVDARSVCGVEVLQSPGCRQISFNPVAPTVMKKALSKMLDRIFCSDGPLPIKMRPSPSTLEVIATHSNGDIRSAIMNLQFLVSNPAAAGVKGVTRVSGDAALPTKGKKRKSDGSVAGQASKDDVKRLLQYVTAREDSLFVFHALGKVLYSKRWGEKADDDKKDAERPDILQDRPTDKLPKHLRKKWQRAPSKVDPDVLFAEAPVDSDVFVSYLHHNYTQFTNEIDECSGILDGLSVADAMMRMEGEERIQRLALTSQYSFSYAIRSTMLNLPAPVPRRKQTLRKSEIWDKMRQTRANEDGIDEMYRRKDGVALVPPTRMMGSMMGGAADASEGDADAYWAGGGGTQRSRTCLAIEMIPFVGVIRKHGTAQYNAFFAELARFPPAPGGAFPASVTGEALGEKEVDDENDGMDMKDEPWSGHGLEEFNAPREAEEETVEETLFDPDDDIVD